MYAQQQSGILRRLKGLMMKHVHGMITCREFEEFVLRYLEDELPGRQRRSFEWHIRMCRECRDYLRAYRQSIQIGRAILSSSDDSLPDDVPEDLIKAVLAARK